MLGLISLSEEQAGIRRLLYIHGVPTMKRPGQLHGAQLPDRRNGPTLPRLCLRCGKKFPSKGSGNRLCGRCAGKKLVSQI